MPSPHAIRSKKYPTLNRVNIGIVIHNSTKFHRKFVSKSFCRKSQKKETPCNLVSSSPNEMRSIALSRAHYQDWRYKFLVFFHETTAIKFPFLVYFCGKFPEPYFVPGQDEVWSSPGLINGTD